MNIALYSDIHLELSQPWQIWQPPSTDADVIMLAGDIGHKSQGIEWARHTFPNKRIVFVAGNHEFYGGSLLDLDKMREAAEHANVDFLENDMVVIDGTRFLGGILWSDFKLYGGGEKQARAMREARECIRDYSAIRSRTGNPIEPTETLRLHEKAVAFLDAELAKPFDGKTVVVTHFPPHREAIERCYAGQPLTAYFVSDLAWLMAKHKIDLWAFGHTHYNIDFIAENGCRVVANQRGYAREFATRDNGFRVNLVIEL